jgi:hypothetical protein
MMGLLPPSPSRGFPGNGSVDPKFMPLESFDLEGVPTSLLTWVNSQTLSVKVPLPILTTRTGT